MCCSVGKCCLCINLRPGVVYIACVLLVWDAFSLLFMSFLAYCVNADRQFAWQILAADDLEDAYLTVTGAFMTTAIGAIVFSVAVLLDITLLAAAIKGRRKLLHGWMVGYPVAYALSLLAVWLNVKLFFNTGYMGLFFFLLHAGLTLYFWTVVRSYYLEVRQKDGDGGNAIWTVFPGGVLPAQEAKSAATGKAMSFTEPPPYTSSDKQPLCDSLNEKLSLGGKF